MRSSAEAPADTLVVGYGNPLRRDDAVGHHVVDRLAADPRLDRCRLLARHQLTPELAEDVAGAGLVVFVDARMAPGRPGRIWVERVTDDDASPAGGASSSSHHVDPVTVLGLAERVYGRCPAAVLVSVSAGSVDLGEGLTPAVDAAVAPAAETVASLSANVGRILPRNGNNPGSVRGGATQDR
jgi:hydrogenase maturation protease